MINIEQFGDDIEVINCEGKFIYPGLVNTHHHFFQAFARNLGGHEEIAANASFVKWLTRVYQIFQKMTSDSIYYSSLVSMADLIKHGCTTAFDLNYCFTDNTRDAIDRQMEAADLMGIRFHAGRGTNTVPMARSKSIWGPYESDPNGPILTSTEDFDEMNSDESKKLHRYNPNVLIQKARHGSIVETPEGEVYLVYLCARPLLPELRCPLGRECSIQKMEWNSDGWLRKACCNDNLAQVNIDLPNLPMGEFVNKSKSYDLSNGEIPIDFFSPRIYPSSFAKIEDKKLILRGQESISSCHKASYLGRKLTGLNDSFEARLDYHSNLYQEYAGICIYYDQMDYILLRKTFNEKMNSEVLELLQVDNGDRREIGESRIAISDGLISLKLIVEENIITFWYKTSDEYIQIGNTFPTDHLSDEYCKFGEFTGTTVGLFCVDAMFHRRIAKFDKIAYCAMNER